MSAQAAAPRRWGMWAAAWALSIFVAIPLARTVQGLVNDSVGRTAFLTLTLAIGALVVVVVAKQAGRRPAALAYLAGIGALYALATVHLADSPEEAFHFVQYGVLSMLVYRALALRVFDRSIFMSAVGVCATVGIIDEGIQWLTPDRYWGFRDIVINTVAASLVQVAIALVLRPGRALVPAGRPGVRIAATWWIVALSLLTGCFLITPPRIAHLANVPGLAWVAAAGGTMIEYGYLYEDPDIGRFRSRLSPEELQRTDAERAQEAGALLAEYAPGKRYKDALRRFTPINDPFMHELRVHLFRRNFAYRAGRTFEPGTEGYYYITVAHKEELILRKYFAASFAVAKQAWPDERLAETAKEVQNHGVFESKVSRSLVTRLNEAQVAAIMIALLGAALWLRQRYGRQPT